MADTPGEKPALTKPKFVKVADLEKGRSGYNVIVQVVECEERIIDTRDGQKIRMVDVVVADETGSAKGFFKSEQAKDIKKGAVIAIRNGVKKIIKNHISLQLDIFGRITVENDKIEPSTATNISDAEIKFEPRKDRQRRPRNQMRGNRNNQSRNQRPRNDRGDRADRGDRKDRNDRNDKNDRNDRKDRGERKDRGDRNDRNRDEKREERPERRNNRDEGRRDRKPRNNDRDYDRKEGGKREFTEKPRNEGRFRERREDRKPMIKINEIGPGDENIRFIAKIMSATLVQGQRGNNLRCVIGDETGLVNAFIPESEHLTVGKTVALFNAEARVVKEHIEIQKARVEPARNEIKNVKENFNLSDKAWVPVD